MSSDKSELPKEAMRSMSQSLNTIKRWDQDLRKTCANGSSQSCNKRQSTDSNRLSCLWCCQHVSTPSTCTWQGGSLETKRSVALKGIGLKGDCGGRSWQYRCCTCCCSSILMQSSDLSTSVPLSLSVRIYRSLDQVIYLSACPGLLQSLPIDMFIYDIVYTCLPAYPSICLPIFPSIHPSSYLSF